MELTSAVVTLTFATREPEGEHRHLSADDVRQILESVALDGFVQVGEVQVAHVGHIATTSKGVAFALNQEIAQAALQQNRGPGALGAAEGPTPFLAVRKGQTGDGDIAGPELKALMEALVKGTPEKDGD